MNTLVLGGNGFIGSHLVDKLLKDGHFVRVFDKYAERFRKPLPGVDYLYGDFGNRGELDAALEGIDTVFHLICSTLPKSSNDDPIFDVESNVVGTLHLLEQCVTSKIRKIVFVSSGGTIYGNSLNLPVGEDSPTDPVCSLGITKLTIEKYLALFNNIRGLDYAVLRPSNPYGSRQDPAGMQGAIAVFLSRVANGKPIEIWGDGSVVRDFIFIDDLVEGVYRAATIATRSRVFNLGSGVGYSLNDVIRIIGDVTGCEPKVDYKPSRPFDVANNCLDISRAKGEMGWEPLVPLKGGIENTWEFIREMG